MRDLPDSANLDHLRRQAKDLLVVLKQTDADTTLAGAQAALAEQYGFDSWAQLKTEVERRQDAAPVVADPSVAERIAREFGLGAVRGAMRHVERCWAGQVWELAAGDERWVLTELAEYVEPDHIEVVDGLVERAIGAGVLAPRPVRGANGRFVTQVDGANWRADRWMQFGPTPSQPPSPEIATAGGRALAQIHALDLEPPGPVVPWLTRRWDEAHWQHVVTEARAADAVWADDLAGAIPGFLELDVVCDPLDPNPRAILSKAWHAPSGVRLAGAGRLVLIGWEHSGATPKDWELGSSLMAWSETISNDYDLIAARAFLDGYREIAGEVVITAPMFTSGVSAELNWTISRANIALHQEADDERELAERNIRVLARNPLTLAHLNRLVDALA